MPALRREKKGHAALLMDATHLSQTLYLVCVDLDAAVTRERMPEKPPMFAESVFVRVGA